jgi:hypothetical protein
LADDYLKSYRATFYYREGAPLNNFWISKEGKSKVLTFATNSMSEYPSNGL